MSPLPDNPAVDISNLIQTVLIYALPVVFAITIHEAAHGYVARYFGDNTVVMFTGDNGTARFGVEKATVDGKSISGQKATMLEGGSRVPLCVSWPGHTPAGKTNNDLTEVTLVFSVSPASVKIIPETIVVLAGFIGQSRAPGALGVPYDKES